MRKIIMITVSAILATATAASANSPNTYDPYKVNVTNNNTLKNWLSNKQAQKQAQAQQQAINNSGNSKSTSNASVNNSGNSNVSIVNKQRLQAPTVVLGDGNSTAPCQGYVNVGGSGPGFGFGFGVSRTVKFCETSYNAHLYNQYFGAAVVQQYLIQRDPSLAKVIRSGVVVKQKAVAKKQKHRPAKKVRKAAAPCTCK